jgi:hypothetical protein
MTLVTPSDDALLDARHSAALPALLVRSIRLVWSELPRVIAVGALWLASLLPVAAAVAFGVPWWIDVLAASPALLGLTGIARYGALVRLGGKPSVREALRLDAAFGLSLVGAVAAACALVSVGGAVGWAGFVLAALIAVLAPMALAYGAARPRHGLSRWRGAAILTAYRPSTALSLLAVSCLAGFATAATVGALGVVLPVLVAAFSAAATTALLDEIDEASRATGSTSTGRAHA